MMLSENSAPGPDGIPAILLQRCAESVSLPMFLLWRSPIDNGEIPNKLTEGIVTPVFKGSNRSDCSIGLLYSHPTFLRCLRELLRST